MVALISKVHVEGFWLCQSAVQMLLGMGGEVRVRAIAGGEMTNPELLHRWTFGFSTNEPRTCMDPLVSRE